MLRIATSDESFTDLKPVGRFREQLVNLFELIGISEHPSFADGPPVRSHSAIRTVLYARHETSFVFLALHAKVLRTVV